MTKDKEENEKRRTHCDRSTILSMYDLLREEGRKGGGGTKREATQKGIGQAESEKKLTVLIVKIWKKLKRGWER